MTTATARTNAGPGPLTSECPARPVTAGSSGPGLRDGRAAGSPRRHRRQGFTLIEVLATMLLLAIVLPVIMKAVTLATATGDQARRRTEAGTLGDAKLAELVAIGAWNGGALSGEFENTGPDDWRQDYHWNAVVQDWTEGTQSGLEQLDLHVTWAGNNGPAEIVLTTLVYNSANNPAASKPVNSSASGGGAGGTGGSGKSAGSTGSTGGGAAKGGK